MFNILIIKNPHTNIIQGIKIQILNSCVFMIVVIILFINIKMNQTVKLKCKENYVICIML